MSNPLLTIAMFIGLMMFCVCSLYTSTIITEKTIEIQEKIPTRPYKIVDTNNNV